MKCPHCNVNLLMTERQGVEIDYCPECRGIWLDRGELDKIIALSVSGAPAYREQPVGQVDYGHHERHDDHERHGHYDEHSGRYGRKRNWLTDLFD